ncbi:putative aarF domain-containing protein kinase 2, partial [Ptiloglossa arizonensis]|uniref:putative aarF domain-containing protein kinase 2 n=1 Tax=Ptiloglossa arizonensis TaxID=3350558 RepID=UPI003FA10948
DSIEARFLSRQSSIIAGIEFLGPIFIKFGQWASTRKDLFPEDICRTLSQLQRIASPHSWSYTKRLLKSTYGTNWKNIFVKFEDKVPIGSGCCAQVYKAWVDLNARVEVTQKPRISAIVQSKSDRSFRVILQSVIFVVKRTNGWMNGRLNFVVILVCGGQCNGHVSFLEHRGTRPTMGFDFSGNRSPTSEQTSRIKIGKTKLPCLFSYHPYLGPRYQDTDYKGNFLFTVVEYFKFGWLVTLFDNILNVDDEIQQDNTYNRKLQPVAIKILHPGIKGQLRRDLTIMRAICKCAMYVVPQLYWLSLTDCIDEFSQIMDNQVDMNLEATNLMQFSKNFAGTNNVIFPSPYTNFTQREILVESFHEGAPIADYLDHDDTRFQAKLAKIGIKTILKMVFRDNFIHCDLHPGNILVETNCAPSGSICAWLWKFIDHDYLPNYPRLVILDCGLVVSLNDRCRRNLRDVFRSVLMGNGELAAEYILEHSSQISPDPDGFKNTMREIVNTHLRSNLNVTGPNTSVSAIMTELFSAMVRHRVKQDGSFSSVILSIVVIEGLGRSLDPNIDIFAEVLPFLFARTLRND